MPLPSLKFDRIVTAVDAAYAAGLIDADGWFTCGHSEGDRKSPDRRSKKWNYWYFRCAVKQVDHEAIQWMGETFGGNVWCASPKYTQNRFGKLPCWQWAMSGEQLIGFLRVIMPHLKIKRDRAAVVLEYYEGKISLNHASPDVYAKELERRRRLHERLKELNSRETLKARVETYLRAHAVQVR